MDEVLETKIHELEHRQIIEMGDLIREHHRLLAMNLVKNKKGMKSFFQKKEVVRSPQPISLSALPPASRLSKALLQRYREEAMRSITESKELNAVLSLLYKLEGEINE